MRDGLPHKSGGIWAARNFVLGWMQWAMKDEPR